MRLDHMKSNKTPKRRSLIIIASFLVMTCIFIQGCTLFGLAIDKALVTEVDSDSYDLSLKSGLGLNVPINEKIVIKVNAYNEQDSYSQVEKVDTDLPVKQRVIYYPLWYLAEVEALESASYLSSDVQLAREIDKPIKIEEILEWYKEVATKDQKAAYILGLQYHEGLNTNINYKLAEKWYRESKLPAAYLNLREMWTDYHEWNPITGYRGAGFRTPDEIRHVPYLVAEYKKNYPICWEETFDSLLNTFHIEQKKHVETNGLSAYIFHISIFDCVDLDPAFKSLPFIGIDPKKSPPPIFILINVSHTDGTRFAEYQYPYNEYNTGHKESILKAVLKIAFNKFSNDLINSKDFVNHYKSISK